MTTLPASLPPRWRWPLRITLALSGWLALAATLALTDAGVPRLLIVCVFLLLCPGAAATRWARPTPWHDRGWPYVVETAFLAVVLSLCLVVLAAEPFYLSDSFTTTRVIVTLAVMTSLLALLPTPGSRRPGARRPGPDDAPSGPLARPAPTTGTGYGSGATVRPAPGERPGGSRRPDRPSGRVTVAVVGAGPYGLATACHLRAAGARPRVFGEPMESWQAHMPDGMFLQTVPAASAIAAPRRGYEFVDFRRTRGLARADDHRPVPLAEYVDYGRWFQEHQVPELEPCRVHRIRHADGGFRLLLDTGEEPLAASVVLATGAVPFAYIPRTLHTCREQGLVSHSSEHTDLRRFAGVRVAVLGAGQSALECATLLHEASARPTVVARTSAVLFDPPPSPGRGDRSWLPGSPPRRALLHAISHGGAAYRRLPAPLRMEVLRAVPRPSGAWWLKERAAGRFPVLGGRTLVAAEPGYGVVRLRLLDQYGWPENIVVDHVLAATGYRVDVRRVDLLEPGLRRSLRVFAGAPVLTSGFESSTAGLYFTGLAAAPSFGPLLRFVSGTGFAARRLTAAVAAGKRR
ncbi:NAD(P)-binding domain-containing protein [Streptomyces sp. DH10]|uniref:NAD(P)-binding domain-containing protein n=1 Tax=Streptomyces sp. DH10 TaxID=3040121 RepID=UPI0024415719|nr:NAD(P)-binding domain-containing protein [Streptomyces sp. DH10]MDG9708626.1 NAD(P)-binding domain-containing protein [Streptomyces sp. DH10]